MFTKHTQNGISSLFLFLLLLISCFQSLKGQNCLTPTIPSVNGITPTAATVAWDAIPNVTGYEVNYRPTNATSTTPWTTLTTNTNTLMLTGLTPNTMYSTQIRSVCGQNFSNYTFPVDFSTQSCIPPGGLSASNLTANTADLQWNVAQGASAYQLLYRVALTNPGVWNTISISGTSYHLTGLAANTLYAARLLSDCGGTLSDTSKITYFSTNPCSVPSNLIITTQTASSISLSWDAIPNATQYNLQYRPTESNTWTTVNSNTNSKTVNGLTGNSLYEFRVRSRCSQNEYSAYTLPVNGFTLPCAMPENAVISNVTVNSVTINWNNATGSTQYRVEYKKEVDPNWTTVNANNTTKTINNLDPDTEYQVRVRSKCTGNQYSAYTDTLDFKTKSCPVPQGLEAVNISFTSAQIQWNTVENATRYQLQYRLLGDTTWTTVNPDSNVRLVNGLTSDSQYEVRVRSRCANTIYSDYSPVIVFRTNICLTPNGVNISGNNQTSVRLTWNQNPNALSYRVEFRGQYDTTWLVRNTNNPMIVLNNLIADSQYVARVSSRCTPGVWSSPTEEISFLHRPCSAQGNLINIVSTANIESHRFTVRWNPVNQVEGQTYNLLWKEVGAEGWGFIDSIPNTSYTLPGHLLPNTLYEVTVQPNLHGTILCRNTIQQRTKQGAKQPTGFVTFFATDSVVLCGWNPITNPSPVNYVLKYRRINPNNPQTWNFLYPNGQETSVRIPGLSSSNVYEFELYAVYQGNLNSIPVTNTTFDGREFTNWVCVMGDSIHNNLNQGKETNSSNKTSESSICGGCDIPDHACQNYAPDRDNPDHTPTLYVRLNFHFLLNNDPNNPSNISRDAPMNFTSRSDGWGNTTLDKTNGYSYIQRMVDGLNEKLSQSPRRVHILTPYSLDDPGSPKNYRVLPGLDQYGSYVYFHPDHSAYNVCRPNGNLSYYNDNYSVQNHRVYNVFLPHGDLKPNSSVPNWPIGWPATRFTLLDSRVVPCTTASADGYVYGLRDLEGGQLMTYAWTNAYRDSYVFGGQDFSKLNIGGALGVTIGGVAHEMGHSLGLSHTNRDNWGPCNPTMNDGCDDTPNPTQGNPCEWNNPTPTNSNNNIMDYNATCNALSPCQIGRIHEYLTSDGLPYIQEIYCEYQPSSPVIIESGENITWRSRRYFNTDVIVRNNAVLTILCQVHFPRGASLIIERGGKVILDGGELTNIDRCPNDMWRGVQVHGNRDLPQSSSQQGKLIVRNNAKIEHAIDGVRFIKANSNGDLEWEYTGGIIEAENSSFENNLRSMEFMYYQLTPSASYIHHCNFTADRLLKDQLNFTGRNTGDHVTVFAVNSIDFRENTFTNTFRNTISSGLQGRGIYAVDAGISLRSNTYRNLNIGVRSDYTGMLSSSGTININTFSDIYESITLLADNTNVSLLGNQINKTPLYPTALTGIALRGTSGVSLTNNTIQNITDGIIMEYVSPYNYNLPYYNLLQGNRLIRNQTGLRTLHNVQLDLDCNEFNLNQNGWHNQALIYNYEFTDKQVGTNTFPATNFFISNTNRDIRTSVPTPNPDILTLADVGINYLHSRQNIGSGRCNNVIPSNIDPSEVTLSQHPTIFCRDGDGVCGSEGGKILPLTIEHALEIMLPITLEDERNNRLQHLARTFQEQGEPDKLIKLLESIPDKNAKWSLVPYYIQNKEWNKAQTTLKSLSLKSDDESAYSDYYGVLIELGLNGKNIMQANSSQIKTVEALLQTVVKHRACAFLSAIDGRNCLEQISPSGDSEVDEHQLTPDKAITGAIYPNPASNEVTFDFPKQEIESIFLYDLHGKLVGMYKVSASQNKFTLDLRHLPCAMYAYTIHFTGNQSSSGRFIKNSNPYFQYY